MAPLARSVKLKNISLKLAAALFLAGFSGLMLLRLDRPVLADSVVWNMVTLTRGFEGCDPKGETPGCTYITYSFPAIMEGPNETVEEALRDDIRGFLYRQGNYQGEDYYEIKEKLFRDYNMFRNHFPDSPQAWFVDKKIEVIFRNPRILSFSKRSDSYFGGAHALPLTYLTSFDLVTGRVLQVQDLILPGAVPRLTDIAERRFREMKGIGPDDSLGDIFSFPGDRFRLTDNMAVTERGLLFFYNVYEIGPYSAGTTELLIPSGELEGMTTPILLPEKTGN